jgi:hypothetical protein
MAIRMMDISRIPTTLRHEAVVNRSASWVETRQKFEICERAATKISNSPARYEKLRYRSSALQPTLLIELDFVENDRVNSRRAGAAPDLDLVSASHAVMVYAADFLAIE